jgi:ketosteroid isomerase-like protein
MHPNAALIERFYTAFAARDAAGMRACYHPEVVFSDPAFGELRGPRAGDMWAMLLERGKDLRVTFSDVHADDATGRAHWEAHYTFSQSGRPVHNRIDAEFGFRDGLIVRHVDRFPFWTWARQALGPAGLLLGWTPIIRNKVRAGARAGLEKYVRDRAAARPA